MLNACHPTQPVLTMKKISVRDSNLYPFVVFVLLKK